MFRKYLTHLVVAASLLAGTAGAATLEDVDSSFYPYKDGGPTFDGLAVGTVIGAANVAQFEAVLDAALFEQVSNGWLEITVGATTSFDLHENYVAATRDGIGKVSLGVRAKRVTSGTRKSGTVPLAIRAWTTA